MSEVKSTRLRFISARDQLTLTAAVERLPFKVEIKQIVKDKNNWVIFFVIPDVVDFNSVEVP